MATATASRSGKKTPPLLSAKKSPQPSIERLRDLKVGVRDMIMLAPQTIRIEKNHNPRDYRLAENHAHLDELKLSIRENGVLVPLLVRFDPESKEAVLVDGECRLRAVLELIREGVEIVAVPTVQVKGNDPANRLVIALTANTGKSLSKWESGTAFQRLVGYGWEIEAIASKLGFTERFVKEAIELADADDEVKKLLSERAVTPSLALYHLRKSGAGAARKLRDDVEKAKASGKQTAARAKAAPVTAPTTAPTPAPTAPSTSTVNNARDELTLEMLVREMFEDVDMASDEYPFIELDREKVAEVAKFLGLDGYWNQESRRQAYIGDEAEA